MAIKMRVLCATGKKKLRNIANEIKVKKELAFNAVDYKMPPSYPCDKERIVVLVVTASGKISDTLRLFCAELNKTRAQNVALMIDGDEKAANLIKDTLKEAGTNVIDEVLYVKGGLPFMGSVKPAEKEEVMAWIERVIANLK